MEKSYLEKILIDVKTDQLSVEEAFDRLKILPFEDFDFAKVDHHRAIRTGFPEVVYCEGKTAEQICTIFTSLKEKNSRILLTRASAEVFDRLKEMDNRLTYHERPRVITYVAEDFKTVGSVVVICAGTADIPVAEEAAITSEISGSKTTRLFDVGVAGLHRLLAYHDTIMGARCIVAVAGMEGALPSVIGGLAPCPVIAVPTSVGYGTHLGGIAPLLTMLNSCASTVSVVNIDNGFGGGFIASMINKQV